MAVTMGLLTYAGSMVYGALETRWSEEPRSRPARERIFAANVVPIAAETIEPVLSTFGELRARRTGQEQPRGGAAVARRTDGHDAAGEGRGHHGDR